MRDIGKPSALVCFDELSHSSRKSSLPVEGGNVNDCDLCLFLHLVPYILFEYKILVWLPVTFAYTNINTHTQCFTSQDMRFVVNQALKVTFTVRVMK